MDEDPLHPRRSDPLLVNTPLNVVQCQATTLTWSGGNPPYNVVASADTGAEIASVNDTTVLWVFAFTAGLSAEVSVVDAQGLSAASSHFSINHGPDQDCKGGAIQTVASTPSSSSTSSTEATTSPPTSTADGTSTAAMADTSATSSSTTVHSSSSKFSSSATLTSSDTSSLSSSSSSTRSASSLGTSSSIAQSSSSSVQIPTSSMTNRSSGLGLQAPSTIVLIGTLISAIAVIAGAILLLCFRRQRRLRAQTVGVHPDGQVVLQSAAEMEGSLTAHKHTRKSRALSSVYTSSRRAASLSISATSTPAHSRTTQNRFSSLATLGHAGDPESHHTSATGEGSMHVPCPSEYSTAFESSERDSDHALDGGVRLAGGRPGSDDGNQPRAPYAYKENRPTGALPPRYTSIP